MRPTVFFRRFKRFTGALGLLAAPLLAACNPAPSPSASSTSSAAPSSAPSYSMRYADPSLAPPAFADPGRRAKLEAAFPEVERYLAEESKKSNFPGLAFGIIID